MVNPAYAGELEILWPDDSGADRNTRVDQIGKKASGLLCVPELWRPPMAVLTSASFDVWRASTGLSRLQLIDAVSKLVSIEAAKFTTAWQAGLILRSSAVNETLRDRGSYTSRAIPADYDERTIGRAIAEIYEDFQAVATGGSIAVIVQPLVPGPSMYLGHMSNERRVSKTVNQWMYEIQSTGTIERFNSQRASAPDERRPLGLDSFRRLKPLLRSVGRWCTALGRGPVHIEWAYSNQKLWLVQIDFEDESPDDGFDPNNLLRPADGVALQIRDVSPLERLSLSDRSTGWRKLDNIFSLAAIRNAPYPNLYFLPAKILKEEEFDATVIVEKIQEISNGRVVVRTDCISECINGENLPRTNSVSPMEAVSFMGNTLRYLIDRGSSVEEICFILHRFIPATAASWVLADPTSQIVRVDSLWGIPDGLQFLPHDTFEFDVKKNEITSETIRYKVGFIQETETGQWVELKVARHLGRSRSLSKSDVIEVASQTHLLAENLGQRVQVMWFCGIPEQLGIGRNLPWFKMPAQQAEVSARRNAGPSRPRFQIRTKEDLITAQSLPYGRHILTVHPDIELIRSDHTFLDELAVVAIAINAPVELFGSVLGHAYYLLERKGVTVIAAGEPSHTRIRGKQTFGKLVRDNIPAVIEGQGEVATLARIEKRDARAALIVKLFEEAHELLNAVSPEDVRGELADIVEVTRSLAAATGVSWEDVEAAAKTKRNKRGGFEAGVVLMSTGWPKTSSASKSQAPNLVSLHALATSESDSSGAEINYVSLIASGAKREVRLLNDEWYRVELTASGVKLSRVKAPANDAEEQLSFPNFDEGL